MINQRSNHRKGRFSLGVLARTTVLSGIVVFSSIFTGVAHASATNCDYDTWYGYTTMNAGDHAQCMIVKGRGEAVWEMRADIHQWVHYGVGPVSPAPIPNVSNICDTRIQWKYKKRGHSSYTYSTQWFGRTRPALLLQESRIYKPRHPFYLADGSNVCMRFKNSKRGNVYSSWTCVNIRK